MCQFIRQFTPFHYLSRVDAEDIIRQTSSIFWIELSSLHRNDYRDYQMKFSSLWSTVWKRRDAMSFSATTHNYFCTKVTCRRNSHRRWEMNLKFQWGRHGTMLVLGNHRGGIGRRFRLLFMACKDLWWLPLDSLQQWSSIHLSLYRPRLHLYKSSMIDSILLFKMELEIRIVETREEERNLWNEDNSSSHRGGGRICVSCWVRGKKKNANNELNVENVLCARKIHHRRHQKRLSLQQIMRKCAQLARAIWENYL